MRRSATVSILSSLVGAAMTYAYLTMLSPSAGCEACDSGLGEEIMVVAGYFVLATVVTDRLARLAYRRTRWLDEERPPTDRERRSTLRLPGRIALLVLLAWLVAAALVSALLAAGGADGRSVARSATTIALVGLLIATFMAFALERLGRPVFRRALEGEDVVLPSRWLGLQPRLLLGWLVSSAVPFASLLLLPFTTEDEDRGDVGVTIFGVSILGLVGGFAITAVAGRGITAPLHDVRRALKHVGEGDLDVLVGVDASGELGQVQQGVNAMVAGLRDRRRIETILGHHVGEEVAQLAVAGETLGSEHREASVLFVDVIGSTQMAERLPPDEVVGRLNDLFAAVVSVVSAEGGLVNKFDGDGALCVFGAPTPQPDHATRALRAARALRAEVAELADCHSGFDAGIGVASGLVVAGRVGAAERYEYTVLGGPVNAAARLTDQAKGRPSRVLAAATTVDRAAPEEAVRWAEPTPVELRGFAEPLPAHEPAAVA
jgi:adenylate cyclase